MPGSPSIQTLLDDAAVAITAAIGSDSARLDAELLLCEVLGKERTYLFTWPEKQPDAQSLARFEALLERRLKGEPVAHILGERDFWSLSLKVNNSTLIPRPDTEILVETVLGLAMPSNARVLDLGTGTGAIALALASEHPAWQVTAVDYAADAVNLAESNREHCGFANVRVLQSDWFSALREDMSAPSFDVIISNPPYIDPQDPHLQKGDVRFEPLSALIANDAGLSDLRLIIEQAGVFFTARALATESAWLVLEHGYDQAVAVQTLLQKAGYTQIRTVKDYGDQDRVTLGCFSVNPTLVTKGDKA
jgi:release factor glutamine methyltransferase